MKNSAKTALSFFVIVISLFAFFFMRSVPVSRIWNGYTVVYVEKSLSERQVLSYFEKFGVEGAISPGSQRVPFYSDVTPVLPDSYGKYLRDRLNYFYDYSKNYMLYYVPQNFDGAVSKAVEFLVKENQVSAGVDGKKQFPFAVPLCVSVVFLVFFFFSRNKFAFFASAIFALFLCFSKPFYSVAAGGVLYLLCCFLSQRIWRRRKAVSVLKKSPYVLIPAIFSVLIAGLSSAECGFLILISVMSSVSALFLLNSAENYLDSKKSFKFTKIFSAPQMVLMYPRTALLTLLSLVPLSFLLISFLITARFAPVLDKKMVLPVPSEDENAESVLPVISDYYAWIWNAKSFPYRNLNDSAAAYEIPSENEEISVPRFEEKNERIVQTTSLIMKYNADFRNSADREVDAWNFGAVEKLMKKQGENVKVLYGSSGGARQKADGFSLILILSSIFVPVLLLFFYTIKSAGKK